MLIAHLPPPGLEGMYDHSPRKATSLFISKKKRRYPKQTEYSMRHYLNEFYGTSNTNLLKHIDLTHDCLEIYPPPMLPPSTVKRTGLYICKMIALIGVITFFFGVVTYIIGKTSNPFENNSLVEVTQIMIFEGLFTPLTQLKRSYDDPFIQYKIYGVFMMVCGFLILLLAMLPPTIATAFRFQSLEGFTSANCTPMNTPSTTPRIAIHTRTPTAQMEVSRVQPQRNHSPGRNNFTITNFVNVP